MAHWLVCCLDKPVPNILNSAFDISMKGKSADLIVIVVAWVVKIMTQCGSHHGENLVLFHHFVDLALADHTVHLEGNVL